VPSTSAAATAAPRSVAATQPIRRGSAATTGVLALGAGYRFSSSISLRAYWADLVSWVSWSPRLPPSTAMYPL
jgi:hypothetical protein